MHSALRPALLAVAAALAVAASSAARGEDEAPPALPRLEPVGDLTYDLDDARDDFAAVLSPTGRHMALAFRPVELPDRRSFSWSAVRVADLARLKTLGSWDDVAIGTLPPAFSPEGMLVAFGARKDETTLTVQIAGTTTGRGQTYDVPHPAGVQGLAEVCAVDPRARRVAIREPEDADGRRPLFVHDVVKRLAAGRWSGFGGPYASGPAGRVLLTPRLALLHVRDRGEDGDARCRLLVEELDTGRRVAELGSGASVSTPRYALTNDGGALLSGDDAFRVEELTLADGARRVLLEAQVDLDSRFLELSVSADERRVLAWSRERKVLLGCDRGSGATVRVEVEHAPEVLALSADGRHAYVRQRDALLVVDLEAGRVAGTLVDALPAWARMSPDGAYLVTREPAEGALRFAVRAVRPVE